MPPKALVVQDECFDRRVLWEELHVLSSFTVRSEGETRIFCVLTVKSFCQNMECSYEFDWADIILAVI